MGAKINKLACCIYKTLYCNMKIGKILNTYRHDNKISIRKMAKFIGISFATLSRIENGREVDGDTLVKLFNYLFKE